MYNKSDIYDGSKWKIESKIGQITIVYVVIMKRVAFLSLLVLFNKSLGIILKENINILLVHFI